MTAAKVLLAHNTQPDLPPEPGCQIYYKSQLKYSRNKKMLKGSRCANYNNNARSGYLTYLCTCQEWSITT